VVHRGAAVILGYLFVRYLKYLDAAEAAKRDQISN
jgi:hypothetical protein